MASSNRIDGAGEFPVLDTGSTVRVPMFTRERIQRLLDGGALTLQQVHSACVSSGGHYPGDDADVCPRCGLHGKLIRIAMYMSDVPSDPGRTERLSALADECGALKTENVELLAENAMLRRRIERLERGKR